ncbi:lipoprotein [Bacteriovorax sp. Seq25_V]|uniref:lipoprotein n=1 Tax=Bacteriovorax sp. Seq25_V TaxID=1201288 RepID=UPI000389F0D1|nr:lipoprotein [Bacteriovorax sp. Seq25_V]EQC47210.1 putative lipoprotein [Bacteriovorax sp. Seq25_V]
MGNKYLHYLFLCIFVVISTSCSLVKKAAITPTGMIIYDASFDQQIENDWQVFENSIYGNIKLVEGFLSQDEGNKNLLATLLKAYTAKGFAIDETYLLQDQLAEKENSVHLKRALNSYTKALYYGVRYLDGIELSSYVNSPDELTKVLDSKLGSSTRDLEVAMYLGQSLGSLVNLQRTNMKVISYLPVAKALYDWACSRDPKLNYGACEIFYATYEAGRPRMLGGNPQKGREIFENAIRAWPKNWLVRASFVQFYAIPMLEEDIYEEQESFISQVAREESNSQYWQGETIALPEKNYVSVFNMIATKRMNIIKKYRKSIF